MTHTGHIAHWSWADEARQRGASSQVNGRPAQPWETELLERAREAARVSETLALFTGVNPKFNMDNGG